MRFDLGIWVLALSLASCGLDKTLLSSRAVAGASGGSAGLAGVAGQTSPDAGGGAGIVDPPDVFDVSEYGACAQIRGSVSCWGGTNDAPDAGAFSLSPATLALPEGVTQLEAGTNHFCALGITGAVYCWGSNDSFQLGSTNTALTGPVRVALPSAARQVACGGAHTCAILSDSTLWCWGENHESQLGQPDTSLGDRVADPIQVGADSDWQRIALGDGHSCGINAGQLRCWGRNVTAQLGLGSSDPGQVSTPTRVGTSDAWIAVASNQEGSCGLHSDGTAWCWGGNVSGRVGVALSTAEQSPVQVTTRTDFTQIDTGTFHSCARTALGTLWCWGRNVEGQLGLGTYSAAELPSELGLAAWSNVRTGRFHSCALQSDGSLWCAGKNDVGQLGDGDTSRSPSFRRVSLP